jgi:hypothetical protein
MTRMHASKGRSMRRLALTLSILAVLAAVPGTAAAASIWTPVPSGTTQDITALTYVNETHIWYGTSGGQIFDADGSTAIHNVATFPGAVIEKIAFDPSNTIGYAVALNGTAYRSVNGGVDWTAVTLPTIHDGCGSSPSMIAVPKLWSVVVPSFNTAYLVGGDSGGGHQPIVLKSTNAGIAPGSPTWTDQNYGVSSCKLSNNGYSVTDVAAVPGAPNSLVFVIDFFGGIFPTSDGLTSNVTRAGEMVSDFDNSPRIVIDPTNASRIWAVDHSIGTCGTQCFQFSTTGGGGVQPMTLHGAPDFFNESLNAIGFGGGTIVTAGDNGQIFTSPNGTDAYMQPADGALATTRWLSVGVSNATHAMIGGAGGNLIKSTNANFVPDTTAPTGVISGPGTVTAGVSTTYAANLSDNAGGSGVDTSSLLWTVPGQPAYGSNPVGYTFPTPGTFLISLAFRDLAGNTATITKTVTVQPNGSAPNAPQHTTSVTDSSGAKLTLGVPNACVPAGSTFKVTLSFKKIKKKGATFVKVFKTDFYIGSKVVKHDTKAPFVQRLTVKVGNGPGSKVTVRARAFIKVRHPKHGKFPTKSISSSITVC